MKASKFSDAQKAFILKEGDEGTPVAEICRKAGINQATYFNWKKKYAGRCCQTNAVWSPLPLPRL
jgi:putative transposase